MIVSWSVKRMGYLTKTGMGYGIDPSKLFSNRPFQVEWLNGGAVMCHVDDLILEDYFPFEGKSYFEDTIHSILWKKIIILYLSYQKQYVSKKRTTI